MPSLRKELNASWARDFRSARDLAAAIPVPSPTTVRTLIDALRTVESVHHERAMHTSDDAPINGRVAFDLHSDGTWTFSGHVRATGFPSYTYGVQAWLQTPDGTVIAAATSGKVFGTDTPGDRQRNFSVSGTNLAIADQWGSLRGGAGSVGYRLHAEISGVLGTALDVVEFLAQGVIANLVLGPAGWAIVLGNELAELGVQIGTPDIVSALIVSGGVLCILGPGGIVPAILAGWAAAEIANVNHREMSDKEIEFAKRVFGDHIDYDRVRLTDLSQPNDRKFVMPSVDGSIVVNLGSAYSDPLGYTSTNGGYIQPGSLFVHELVHAWQITQRTLPSVASDMSSNYDYHSGPDPTGRLTELAWTTRTWDSFNIEQQAHIVNDWYGAYVQKTAAGDWAFVDGVPVTDLDSQAALTDPAYRFIRDHIRLGAP
ncbi:hypothetical protein ACRCUN_02440 [Mycobacterium sp. LTG2003]